MSLVNILADSNKRARLFTRTVISQNGKTCALRFHFYMYGAQSGKLNVYAQYSSSLSNALYTAIGDHGQQWIRALVPVPQQNIPFKFVIEYVIGNGLLSDIAIDDISFSDGCTQYTGSIPITNPPIITGNPGTQPTAASGQTLPPNGHITGKTDAPNLKHQNPPKKSSNGNYPNNLLL